MENKSELQAGDIVRLNSGSPDMRVINPAVQVVAVEYLDGEGKAILDYFLTACVRKTHRQMCHKESKSVGFCLNCGARLSKCGKPFSAELACPKCGAVNVYEESQQAVSLKQWS